MTKRERTKHAEEAQKFRQAVEREPVGSTLESCFCVGHAETAAHISDGLSSPGLQPPVETHEIHQGRMIPKRA
jgi:hypothetical protein